MLTWGGVVPVSIRFGGYGSQFSIQRSLVTVSRGPDRLIPRELVRDAMKRFGVPGAAIGIVHGCGEEILGFGDTSAENPLPVDGETLFQIGSITKTFTATAAMRLVEMGRLSLDEPVRTYLPDLRLADEQVARAVSMRHLLTHTGGWAGDYFASFGAGDDALAEMVAHLDHLEQLTPLGEVWSYNNAGFYIVGRVVEVLAGKPFDAALRELVLEPLGLTRSFLYAEEVLTYRFAVGHDRTGAVTRPWGAARSAAPAGGLITNVRELLRYARVQWEPGTLLSATSLAQMRQPHAPVRHTMGDAIGLGWFLFERDEHAFVTHGGSTLGQQALLVVGPEDRFALAVLTNHDNGSALARVVQTEALRSAFAIPPLEQTYLELSAEELDEYVGNYDSRLLAATITLNDGQLLLELRPKGGFPEPDSPPRPAPPPTRLAFVDKDAVVALDPPLKGARSDFLRGRDNEIVWYRSAGRLHRRPGH
jgi:CubicO group peptidase (beta-lactamase class C family)